MKIGSQIKRSQSQDTFDDLAHSIPTGKQ